jgi:lipopolysaccharide transport system permease protein
MQHFSISPTEMFASFWRNRRLISALCKREIAGRYRGSVVGIGWSLVNPLLMLCIYTFVFSVVFETRWGDGAAQGKTDFAIILFVGLIASGLFGECINRAPGLIFANANYVKKVVFPLEILPWVTFGSALFHTAVTVVALLAVQAILKHQLPWTIIFFPVILLPLVFATMGFAWFLAALGVYVRDIGHLTGMFTTVMLFLSPVFYPISALPPEYRGWLRLNPLTLIIEEGRNSLIFCRPPDAGQLAIMLAVSLCSAWAGFAWFQKTRRGFADVL